MAIIAAAENMPTEKAYNYFGSMDMLGRIGMSLHLTNDAGWPPHLRERIKNIRKALQDGEKLQWKRNQAVHGVHKGSGAPESFSLTLPKERGGNREMDVSINDLHMLVIRLGELVAEAWSVFNEYGQWKFGPSTEQNVSEAKPDRSGFIDNIKYHIKNALKRLVRNL